jgi:5-methylthioadenosine/S-adenosylhomocysteine deaminase|tara:strand:+ start:124706 stop:126034 length:1329 start_codon:yes stop_codon:yes gene_type:complete
MKAPANFIVSPRWLVSVVPKRAPLENYSLVVQAGKIHDLLPAPEADRNYQGLPKYELKDHLLIPGLINMHGHAAMTLLRGYADDLPLMQWLEEGIWPAEARWVDSDFVRDGTSLAISEMLLSGTTTFSDQYFFPRAAAEAAIEAGMRCQIASPVLEFPSNWAKDAEDYLQKGLNLRDEFRPHSLISMAFGPHAPYTVSDNTFTEIAKYSNELQSNIQVHLHESEQEVDDAIKEHGKRPIQRLFDLAVLGPNTQCIHMTQLVDADMDLLEKSNASVVHCPSSNLKLANGFCPVKELSDRGINVCIGTDGAASNNSLDMLAEIRMASLLAKGHSGDPTALDALSSLECATINAARALGMEDQLGSLEVGKQADMVAIRLDSPESTPIYNPISQLIYSTNSSNFSHSWIQGKMVMEDRKLTNLHLPSIIKRARHWAERIRGASND